MENLIYKTTLSKWGLYLGLLDVVLFLGLAVSMALKQDWAMAVMFICLLPIGLLWSGHSHLQIQIFNDRLIIFRPMWLFAKREVFLFSETNRYEMREPNSWSKGQSGFAIYQGNKGVTGYNFRSISSVEMTKVMEVLTSLGRDIKYVK
jgi:hypothetical protein